MSIVMSVDEKRWQAENDARTLAEAKVIVKDSERLNAAKVEAKRMADEKQKEVSAMRSVAGSKPGARPSVNAARSDTDPVSSPQSLSQLIASKKVI